MSIDYTYGIIALLKQVAPPPPSDVKTLRSEVMREALEELGVKEQGGDNKGKRVAEFLKEAGVTVPAPWCAAYVNWSAKQAAAGLGVESPLEAVPLEAYVQSYYQHGVKKNWKVAAKDIRPGDLFLVWFPSLNRYGHIGFVAQVNDDNTFVTLEGNSNDEGSREGYEVCQNKRKITDRIVFLSPWGD